jgi:hypothetical protein
VVKAMDEKITNYYMCGRISEERDSTGKLTRFGSLIIMREEVSGDFAKLIVKCIRFNGGKAREKTVIDYSGEAFEVEAMVFVLLNMPDAIPITC